MLSLCSTAHRGSEGSDGTPRTGRAGAVVLLVQSDPDTLAMYADFLELYGYRCVTAGDTADALVRAPTADIIVTGIQIPGHIGGSDAIGDGFDFIRRLKGDSRTARVPVIVLTTNSLPTTRAKAERAGCRAFLTKPCLPGELLFAVQRVLSSAESQDDVTRGLAKVASATGEG